MEITQEAREIRAGILGDAVERFGLEKVEGWAEDPVKVSAINALAQIQADGQGGEMEDRVEEMGGESGEEVGPRHPRIGRPGPG